MLSCQMSTAAGTTDLSHRTLLGSPHKSASSTVTLVDITLEQSINSGGVHIWVILGHFAYTRNVRAAAKSNGTGHVHSGWEMPWPQEGLGRRNDGQDRDVPCCNVLGEVMKLGEHDVLGFLEHSCVKILRRFVFRQIAVAFIVAFMTLLDERISIYDL